MSTKRSLPGFVKLLLCMGFIWLLLWVITPMWVSLSPLHQEFAEAQEQYDVPIGALYYNDLPFIIDAFHGNARYHGVFCREAHSPADRLSELFATDTKKASGSTPFFVRNPSPDTPDCTDRQPPEHRKEERKQFRHGC